MDYAQFLQQADDLRSRTARFFRGDLHVHTHDSHDFLNPQPPLSHADLTSAERDWKTQKQPIPSTAYHEAISTCVPALQLIAVTDHHVCDVACDLAGTAPVGHLVVPGIEIKATVNQLSASDSIDLLCLFDPVKNPTTIWNHVAPDSNYAYRSKESESLVISDLAAYIQHNIHRNGGICIAAHVDQAKGLRKYFFDVSNVKYVNLVMQRRRLENLKAEYEEIAKTEGGQTTEAVPQELTRRLSQITEQIGRLSDELRLHQYALQEKFLHLISECAFDAIQIQKDSDAQHYRGEHTRSLGLLPIAAIVASDAHCLRDIGRKATWLKMSSLSFVGLKRALEFPICRVRIGDYAKPRFPKLLALRFVPDENAVSFFQKDGTGFATIGFADNLNCFIGGRGSGKSAAIDCMKLLFSGVPAEALLISAKFKRSEDAIGATSLPDWLQRLEATMQGTTIEAAFQYEQEGKEPEKFVLSLPFDYRLQTRARTLSSTGIDTGIGLSDSRLDVDVYGWSEIESLGASSQAQRELIDRFAQAGQFLSPIAEAKDALEVNRAALTKMAEEVVSVLAGAPVTEYAERQQERDFYNSPEIAEAFAETDVLEADRLAVQSFVDSIAELLEQLRELKPSERVHEAVHDCLDALCHESVDPTTQAGSGETGAPVAEPAFLDVGRLRELRRAFGTIYRILISYRQAGDGKLAAVTTALEIKLAEILQKAAGKDAVAKERRRQAKTRYDEAQAQVSLAQEKLTRLGEMFVARAGLVGKLNAACDARAGARRQIVDQVNAHLEEEVNSSRISIKITLAERADVREFEGLLNEIVAWTKARLHHKERKVSRLVGRLSPREVRDALLDRNAAVFQLLDGGMEDKVTETQANGIVEECSPTRYLSLSDTTKIKYYDPIKVDAVLRLDEVTRDDTPEILLNQNPEEGGAFAPIAQLSPGQRCSAMLPIILLRGNCPVVIDQPEDNLDNRLICDVVVDVLQRLKEHRQIIVATHNANIPVSADAEQVVVMEALGRNAGRVAAQGPIDDEQIVSQVKAIMEGGDEAFRLRARRYNYELRPRRVS